MMQEINLLNDMNVGDRIRLPEPKLEGIISVEEALARRRSIRRFAPEPLTLLEISQLLWSAQGVTSPSGKRTAPSAGAMYPLEVYLLCEQGVFRYLPEEHTIEKTLAADIRAALAEEAQADDFLADAPVALLFTAVHERTTHRYGERGIRYVHIDLGHAGQNVHLQAEALDLVSVALGAFDDAAVAKVAQLPEEEAPVYIMPVGRKA